MTPVLYVRAFPLQETGPLQVSISLPFVNVLGSQQGESARGENETFGRLLGVLG